MPLPSGGIPYFFLTETGHGYHDPVAQATVVVVTATGTGSFTIPSGVTSIFVEAWGGGGNGGTTTSQDAGGGSGAFMSDTLACTGGDTLFYEVAVANGSAASAFRLNNSNLAASSGAYRARTAVLTVAGAIGAEGVDYPTGSTPTKFAGVTGTAAQGGGGSRGGSGGSGASGPVGVGIAGAAGAGSAGGAGGAGDGLGVGGTAPGGAGGDDVNGGGGGAGGAGGGGAGGNGGAPGAGGGGGGSSGGVSGTGGRGQIRYTYTPPASPSSYPAIPLPSPYLKHILAR